MILKVTKTNVWAAEIDDRPGGLALALKALAGFGADLDCVIARRSPDKKGKSVVFVEPLSGKEQLENAEQAGFHTPKKMVTLKIEGLNKPGMGSEITKVIGDTGANMHGLSSIRVGRRYVCYASFDTVAEADKAADALKEYSSRKLHWPTWKGAKEKKKVEAFA